MTTASRAGEITKAQVALILSGAQGSGTQ